MVIFHRKLASSTQYFPSRCLQQTHPIPPAGLMCTSVVMLQVLYPEQSTNRHGSCPTTGACPEHSLCRSPQQLGARSADASKPSSNSVGIWAANTELPAVPATSQDSSCTNPWSQFASGRLRRAVNLQMPSQAPRHSSSPAWVLKPAAASNPSAGG